MALNAGTGDEQRHSFGSRFFGYRRGVSWDVEAMLQLGSFAGKDLRAWFWRESAGDGVYDIGNSLLRPDSGSDALFIATQPEVNLTWNVNRNVTFVALYSVVFPGLFIEESGPAETLHFAAGHVQFRY